MKIKLPSLPFWARSPRYRANIKRRLGLHNGGIGYAGTDRHLGLTCPADYRRQDFTAGPCYLPPDAPVAPGRWRWERDPAVIGAVLGFIAIGFGLYFLGGF